MVKNRNIIFATVMLALVVSLGTVGYMTLEHWNFLDSLYMTVITISTVGFSEVNPVSNQGRILTMAVLISGLGVLAYVVGTLTRTLVEGQLLEVMGRKKLERQIKKLKHHYIICGYGRVGRIICEEIKKSRPTPVVVIDSDSTLTPMIEEHGYLYYLGDATSEETLLKAGILSAKGLATALDSEADNVYITLTAKGLNPELFVLARAGRRGSEIKLERAGADRVISPHQIGGFRMAQALLRPNVAEFIDFATHDPDSGMNMEEIPIRANSQFSDISLVDSGIRQQFDLIIVAIKKTSGEMIFNPASHTRIQIGDTLIALGQRSNLIKLERLLGNINAE
ncbi:MAG: NAD-binding protein [Deltaproteobacteria bacterium]|jgi:voltage-gated potassium channel|nr:NAD-binding protein [Deltaproteobacteria bacterium]